MLLTSSMVLKFELMKFEQYVANSLI